MVKEHHLWLPSMPRLACFNNKFQDCHIQGCWWPLPAVSLDLCHFPVPEVSVLSKILPLPQHRVFDCIDILSWDPIHPVVRCFCWAQLKCLQLKMTTFTHGNKELVPVDRHSSSTAKPDQPVPPAAPCSTQGIPQLFGGQLKEHCREQELQRKTWVLPFYNITTVTRTPGQFQDHEEIILVDNLKHNSRVSKEMTELRNQTGTKQDNNHVFIGLYI